MKILCVITETGLTPKYESDREEFKKLKRNAEVVVTKWMKRSLKNSIECLLTIS